MKNEITARQLLKHKADQLTDSEAAEVLEYINIMESLGEQASMSNPLDEAFLKLLSEAMRSNATRAGRVYHQLNALKN